MKKSILSLFLLLFASLISAADNKSEMLNLFASQLNETMQPFSCEYNGKDLVFSVNADDLGGDVAAMLADADTDSAETFLRQLMIDDLKADESISSLLAAVLQNCNCNMLIRLTIADNKPILVTITPEDLL